MRIEQLFKDLKIQQKIALPIMVLASGNLITCIMEDASFVKFVLDIGVFLLFSLFLLLIKKELNKNFIAYFLLLVSCVFMIKGEYTDLTVGTLLSISISIHKYKKYNFIFLMVTMFMVAVRFTIDSIEVSRLMAFLAGNITISIIINHYLKVSENNNIVQKFYKPGMVNSDVVDILRLHVEGYDWPDINDILTEERCEKKKKRLDSQLSRKVREERNSLGFNNQDQFIFWLLKNGVLDTVSDESDILKTSCDNL